MDTDDVCDREQVLEERLAHLMKQSARQDFFTQLQFWRACPARTCRRHYRCTGDVRDCGEIFWPVVPAEFKAWWRAVCDAFEEGNSMRKACEYGAEARVRHRRIEHLKSRPER
jgi:hypothetical protein